MDKQKNEFGKRLQTELHRRGMTQKEMAQEMGVSRMAIHKIIRGAHQPTLNTLDLLAKALDLPLALLISWCGYELFAQPHVTVTLTIPQDYTGALQELAAFLEAVELEQIVLKEAVLRGDKVLA